MASSQYVPFCEPLNKSAPNERDLQIDEALFEFMKREIKQESEAESVRRSQVLSDVKKVFLEWVQYVATEVIHLPCEEARDVGGELFVSGSHKLNVREPGADIDTICVAPNFCLREHFFTSLKERLLAHKDVKNLTSVETAKVPLITFDFREVNIDFLFARMAENSIPNDINERIFEDDILKNLDEKSVLALNGPRATYMISRLVPNYENFLIVLRCVRVWAKRRGLYGNKFGYLGGINCNILVAFVCQLYPAACPSTLLHRFFRVYSGWQWPSPIKLNHIKPNMPGDDFRIWPEEYDFNDLMPMITPSYPAANSAKSVSENTLRLMTSEFVRGNDIMTKIMAEGGEGWDRLFVPSGFFVEYENYLACHIVCSDEARNERYLAWKGQLQSVLRFFLDRLQLLPLTDIRLLPNEFPSNKSPNRNSCCYYIGFNVDRSKLGESREINIFQCEQEFWDKKLSYFKSEPDDPEDCFDFITDRLCFRTLPDEVFQSLGGRGCAKMMRNLAKEAARSKAAPPSPQSRPLSPTTAGLTADATQLTTPAEASTQEPLPSTVPAGSGSAHLSGGIITTPQVTASSTKDKLSDLLALLTSSKSVSKPPPSSSNNKRRRDDAMPEGSTGMLLNDTAKKKSRILKDVISAPASARGTTSAAAQYIAERCAPVLFPPHDSRLSRCGTRVNTSLVTPGMSWDKA